MTDYNYVFGSLRTERILAEIPLFGTYMDMELNVGGRFDGSFNLDQSGVSNETLLEATAPGRTFVCCERNGIPVWIGYVWSRTYQSQAKSVQLYAQSFEYLPTHQLMRTDFTRTGIEQLTIFSDLWEDLQSVEGRNMNIQLPAETDTIVPRTIAVKATDYKYYSEVISSFADTSTGFDWTIDVAKSGNFYVKQLRVGYPVAGTVDPTRLAFEYPGSILNYYATESMSDAGTNVYALGAGEGSTMLVGAQEDVFGQIAAGAPRWDLAVSRKDINSQTLIDAAAIQAAVNARPPRFVVKPSLKADKDPVFGSFGLGDACTLFVKDARFPTGLRLATRIVKWTLNPQSAVNADEYALVMAGDEDE